MNHYGISDDSTEHDCVFGPWERSWFAGTPHRKCVADPACRVVSLDGDDEADALPYWSVRVAGSPGSPFTFDTREEADAFARSTRGTVTEYEHADDIGGAIVADYSGGSQ